EHNEHGGDLRFAARNVERDRERHDKRQAGGGEWREHRQNPDEGREDDANGARQFRRADEPHQAGDTSAVQGANGASLAMGTAACSTPARPNHTARIACTIHRENRSPLSDRVTAFGSLMLVTIGSSTVQLPGAVYMLATHNCPKKIPAHGTSASHRRAS